MKEVYYPTVVSRRMGVEYVPKEYTCREYRKCLPYRGHGPPRIPKPPWPSPSETVFDGPGGEHDMCYVFRYCDVLKPGTGIFVPEMGDDWGAATISQVSSVEDLNGEWAYSFTPIYGAVFHTGIFNSREHSDPSPGRYAIAVDFQVNRFRIKAFVGRKLEVSLFTSWKRGERLTIRGNKGQFSVVNLTSSQVLWSRTGVTFPGKSPPGLRVPV